MPATRADGRPAYVNAPPRLRQSTVNSTRSYSQKLREMRCEEAQLAREAGEDPQPGPGNGTAYAILGLLTLAVWLVLFKGLGLI
ncbi:hypothetical protein GCM10011349_20300 [Novosphingobium indicum]|uniref:Uncharacterized protein n=1 Tax=Novosphingobium indicum TaxID=462949 RepID=A0ABQ2JKG3_9SPHN|nr:hypothetical protein [Novosphingobium indicum]GGN49549.1 hypothetical protein GCM10011349_20300 [Novosphingobium indicum]